MVRKIGSNIHIPTPALRETVLKGFGNRRTRISQEDSIATATLKRAGYYIEMATDLAQPVIDVAWKYRKLLLGTLVVGVLAGAAINSQESPKRSLQDAPTPLVKPETMVKSYTYTVKAGDTLWGLVGSFEGTEDPKKLDAIKDVLFAQYGDRINHLIIGEKITIQSVNGKIEVNFGEKK